MRCPVSAKELEVLVGDIFRDCPLRGDIDHGGLDIGHDFHDRFLRDIDRAGRWRDFAMGSRQGGGWRHGRRGLGGRSWRLCRAGPAGRKDEKDEQGKRKQVDFHNAFFFTYELSRLGIKLPE